MKPIVLVLAALAARPTLGDGPKPSALKDKRIESPSRPATTDGAPRWLQKKVKPFVNKTVVTR